MSEELNSQVTGRSMCPREGSIADLERCFHLLFVFVAFSKNFSSWYKLMPCNHKYLLAHAVCFWIPVHGFPFHEKALCIWRSMHSQQGKISYCASLRSKFKHGSKCWNVPQVTWQAVVASMGSHCCRCWEVEYFCKIKNRSWLALALILQWGDVMLKQACTVDDMLEVSNCMQWCDLTILMCSCPHLPHHSFLFLTRLQQIMAIRNGLLRNCLWESSERSCIYMLHALELHPSQSQVCLMDRIPWNYPMNISNLGIGVFWKLPCRAQLRKIWIGWNSITEIKDLPLTLHSPLSGPKIGRSQQNMPVWKPNDSCWFRIVAMSVLLVENPLPDCWRGTHNSAEHEGHELGWL